MSNSDLSALLKGLQGHQLWRPTKGNYEGSDDWYDPVEGINKNIDNDIKTTTEEMRIVGAQIKADVERAQQRLMDTPQLISDAASAAIKVQEASAKLSEQNYAEDQTSDQPDVTPADGQSKDATGVEKTPRTTKKISSVSASRVDTRVNPPPTLVQKDTKPRTQEVNTAALDNKSELNEVFNENQLKVDENSPQGVDRGKLAVRSAYVGGSGSDGELRNQNRTSAQAVSGWWHFVRGEGASIAFNIAGEEGRTWTYAEAVDKGRYDLATKISKELGFQWLQKTGGFKKLNPWQLQNQVYPEMRRLQELEANEILQKQNKDLKKVRVASNIAELASLLEGEDPGRAIFGTAENNYKDGFLYTHLKEFSDPTKPLKERRIEALNAVIDLMEEGNKNGSIDLGTMIAFRNSFIDHSSGKKNATLDDIPWAKKSMGRLNNLIGKATAEKEAEDRLIRNGTIRNAMSDASVELKKEFPNGVHESDLRAKMLEIQKRLNDEGINIDLDDTRFTLKNFSTIEDLSDEDLKTQIIDIFRTPGPKDWTKARQLAERIYDVDDKELWLVRVKDHERLKTTAREYFDKNILPTINANQTIVDDKTRGLVRDHYWKQFESRYWDGILFGPDTLNTEDALSAAAAFVNKDMNIQKDITSVVSQVSEGVSIKAQEDNITSTISHFDGMDGKTIRNTIITSDKFLPGEKQSLAIQLKDINQISHYYGQLSKRLKLTQNGIPVSGAQLLRARLTALDEEAIRSISPNVNKKTLIQKIENIHGLNTRVDSHKASQIEIDSSNGNSAGYKILVEANDTFFSSLQKNPDFTLELNPDFQGDLPEFYSKDKKLSDYTINEVSQLADTGAFTKIGNYNIDPTNLKILLREMAGASGDNPTTPFDESKLYESGFSIKFTPDIEKELILRLAVQKANQVNYTGGALSGWLTSRVLPSADIKTITSLLDNKIFDDKWNSPTALLPGLVQEMIKQY